MKTINLLGKGTNTAGETISAATDSIELASKEAVHADIIINLKTLTGGSSPTVTVAIQEYFSDVGWVETAVTAALSATGVYTLSADGQTGQTAAANSKYGFAMLGKGTKMQAVTTVAGSPTGVETDVYVVQYGHH